MHDQVIRGNEHVSGTVTAHQIPGKRIDQVGRLPAVHGDAGAIDMDERLCSLVRSTSECRRKQPVSVGKIACPHLSQSSFP